MLPVFRIQMKEEPCVLRAIHPLAKRDCIRRKARPLSPLYASDILQSESGIVCFHCTGAHYVRRDAWNIAGGNGSS